MFKQNVLFYTMTIQTFSAILLILTNKPEMNLAEGFISGLWFFVFFLMFVVIIDQLLMLAIEKFGGRHGKSL